MPVILAFWHGQHFLTPFIRNKPSYRARVLISRHRDGEFNAIAVERLGIGTIRGSGDHGGGVYRKGGVGAVRGVGEGLGGNWEGATPPHRPERGGGGGPRLIPLGGGGG